MQTLPASSNSFVGSRPHIVCIVGTGWKNLLQRIVAGGRQQIGATFLDAGTLEEQTIKVDRGFELRIPGVLILDSLGYENFDGNGSPCCDFAILVIDIWCDVEPKIDSCVNMLRRHKIPFVVALDGIEKCHGWKSTDSTSTKDDLDSQLDSIQTKFHSRWMKIRDQLHGRGVKCALFWENDHIQSTASTIPVSALTGWGLPDLIHNVLKISQILTAASSQATREGVQCLVSQVHSTKDHGIAIDVLLVNGILNVGDQIVVAGEHGPFVTTVTALLTPNPLKESQVKAEYIYHSQIYPCMGVRLCALGLEQAVGGCYLELVGPNDDIEDLKKKAQAGLDRSLNFVEKEKFGVYAKARCLSSLKALCAGLKDMKIPVSQAGLGEVRTNDVRHTMIMKEQSSPEYAVILCFDVAVAEEAQQDADAGGIQIVKADMLYKLLDMLKGHMKQVVDAKKQCTYAITCHVGPSRENVQCFAMNGDKVCEVDLLPDEPFGPQVARAVRAQMSCVGRLTLLSSEGTLIFKEHDQCAVFPVIMQIDPQKVYSKTHPFIFGVKVLQGRLRKGTPIVVPQSSFLAIGIVDGIEKDGKPVQEGKQGQDICIKILPGSKHDHITLGRHFDHTHHLYSHITRGSIDSLKENHKDEMSKEDWQLVIRMKEVFQIGAPGS